MNFFNPSNHIKQLWAVCHKIPECSSMKVNSTPARPAFQWDAEVWQHPGPASWTVHSQWLVVQCSSLSDDTTHKKHKPPGRACSSLSVWLVCLMWCWELPGIIKFFARIFFDIKYGIVCLLASRPSVQLQSTVYVVGESGWGELSAVPWGACAKSQNSAS